MNNTYHFDDESPLTDERKNAKDYRLVVVSCYVILSAFNGIHAL